MTTDLRQKSLRIILLFVLIGEACRLAQYFSRQSLATAEVQLLMNVQRHPAGQLPFVRLDYFPLSPVAAPPVFLWFTKWIGETFHYGELAARLIPSALSLIALPLFAIFVWRLLDPVPAAWAVIFFSLSDSLIFQGATSKPYSGDVLIALLILWLAADENPRRKLLRIGAASLLAAFGVWLSYTTVFAFAAAAIAWGLDLRKKPRELIAWAALCAVPAFSFLTVFFLSMRIQHTAALDEQWQSMIPDYSNPLTLPGWFIARTWELFQYQLFPIGQPMILAAAAGAIALIKANRNRLFYLLIGPLVMDLISGLTQQYIYGGSRITLFLAPSLLILIAIGLASLPKLIGKWARPLQTALAIVPLAMAGLALYQLVFPRTDGEMRTAAARLASARRPGEPVFIEPHDASQLAVWYGPDDDAVHLVTDAAKPVHEDYFWMILAYNPRKYQKTSRALRQPGNRIDESRSIHGNGFDVLWFVPEPEIVHPLDKK